MYHHKLSEINLAVEPTDLPVITPSRLVAQPSASATSVDTSGQSDQTLVKLVITTIVIIIVIMVGIGVFFYYRRLRKNREIKQSNSILEEDGRRTKMNEIEPNFQINNNTKYVMKHGGQENLNSILLEFSSLAGGMKPPPTTALPPIPTEAQTSTYHRRTLDDKRPSPPPILTGLKTAHVRNVTISNHIQSSNIMMNSKQEHPIIQLTPVLHTEFTKSRLQKESILISNSQLISNAQILSSDSPTTIHTLGSSTETSISLFGWEDSTDKISELDNSLTSKWIDIVDSPTLPSQHPSVLSVVTKKSSGFLVPQSWARAPWHDETSSIQSETDPPNPLIDKENNHLGILYDDFITQDDNFI
ncbi:hypothetical protein F8M41_011633 [Gigaspora margarita]|uniref:Uncharacterized protein n=1 Tax=Gigaspora margarita TaxID=4874 RepID=A0A8H3X0U3_GIGMA|nr:hypothetical protein F8M41_011633 [Gigaspora margarita]